MGKRRFLSEKTQGALITLYVLLLLVALPIAAWLDLRDITAASLLRQANDLDSLIASIRGYYSKNVVARVLSSPGSTKVVHNYTDILGAIPIPATLSIELGQVISEQQSNIGYRFVSDYPFQNRPVHYLDSFETSALNSLRENPHQKVTQVSGSLFTDQVRHIAPVLMFAPCVSCHNAHPDSPKRDWKIGDVRGIQEIVVSEPIVTNIWSFKYLLAYLVFAGASGIGFIGMQWRQTALISGMNEELENKNEFLASISAKISRYLSPQISRSILSGQTDVTIHAVRKKLTIFFSDIQDFTHTAERMQPEEIAALLNEYLTEMSRIALEHGGTVDKFIGDAILVFFGDPETQGTAEDAKACLRMAIAMQGRLTELNSKWRNSGVEKPFRARMGINTGFCDVGNFGSADRMDYTIIGAEANLAARLQSIAKPGHIILSYETFALVRDIVTAHPLPPIAMKGISREIVPYEVEATFDNLGRQTRRFSEHMRGLDLYFDPAAVEPSASANVRLLLQRAMASLDEHFSTEEQSSQSNHA
ncbi:MAG TPA: adenylate/guanylate cyclase domain-containing protein [Methylocella sp.]|nr:adenylate/guanylate cyclase domain-containing protein [Methylocella sp.]